MNNPRIITLNPKSISLTVKPIRRTIKWIDEEGFKHTRRNQIRVKVEFNGIYENEFNAGDLLFDWDHKQNFVATSKNSITTIETEFKEFSLPARLMLNGSAYMEQSKQ